MKRLVFFLLLAATAQGELVGMGRGTGTNVTSGTSFTFSPSVKFSNGSWAVLVIAADNTGGGGAFNFTTVTDTLGNTWTRQNDVLYDPGSASAGVQGAFFTTAQNGGTLTASTTITVSNGNATINKVWALWEVASTSGGTIVFGSSGDGTGSGTTAPTVTTSSLTSGTMVIGGLFNEYGTAQTVTGDTDSVSGVWSVQLTNEVGTTAGGMTVQSQWKTVTATATQTFNPTLGTSSNVVVGWISLTETAPTARSALNPSGAFLSL